MTRHRTTTLALELITNQTSLIISVTELRVVFSEYIVMTRNKVVSFVQIQGKFSPTLLVDWDQTEIIDNLTGSKASLKEETPFRKAERHMSYALYSICIDIMYSIMF